MGGGTEVELTHGAVSAVSAMSRLARGLRPVLQLAEAPRPTGIVGGHTEIYGLLLSDGVHSQEGRLVTSLNGLVRAGLLRGGSVVRVFDYVCSNSVENPRVIVVIKLEILQTECTLIGSPTIFDANAAQPKLRSYSDSLGIHRHRMISRAKQGVTNVACSPDQSLVAKMQQLSLNSYQGQVPSTVGGFDCPGNAYEHPVQPLYQQAHPMHMNKGLVANNEAQVISISALNPYQVRWTIKVRVTGKTEPRYLGKAKIFSFDLIDANGGQIRATGLNSAVDKFYDQIVAGNVYLISGGLVKSVPKMFSPLNSDYQIILVPTTSIEIYSGDDSGIPGLQLESGLNPILALKCGSVVSGFSGKSMGTTSSSQLKINPDCPEAEKLRQWYATESKNNVCRTIAEIKDENFGMLGQPELITVMAVISYVHTDAFCYPACTLMFNGKRCNKKVTCNGDGWWCKRCLQSSEACEYRYMFMCQIQDHSGSSYATAFHDAAEEIVGHKAEEIFTLKNVQQDDAKFEEIMQGVLWREYVLKLRVKERVGHGVKISIVKAEKIDPSDMSRRVLGQIDNLLKGNSSSAPGAQGTVTQSVSRTNLQAGLTAQTSNNASCGMTIGGTSSRVPKFDDPVVSPESVAAVVPDLSGQVEPR